MMQEQSALTSTTDSTEKPSETIVGLIADLEGVDPVELSPSLYSVIDPDALDSLFHSSPSDDPQTPGYIRFQYCGYEIRMQDGGEIMILNH